MSSLNQLSLTGMISAIEGGDCSADDIWRSCIDQIARHEPDIRAWQQVLSSAENVATSGNASQHLPLRGLPIGLKDTMDVRGLRAERGSRIWKGREPHADAYCVSALKHAGGRVMGKTVTTEFAYFTPGPTANPHNLTHTPGGSSSGSAAAVAAGMVPLALGSQTAASVIRPAAYCGVAGYVATAGSISLRGVMPLAHTFDALGLLARDVADLQLVHAVLTRMSPEQDSPRRKPKAVLAIDGTMFGALEPEMLELHARAIETLASHGVRVQTAGSEFIGTDAKQAWVDWHRQLMAYEAAQTLAFEYNDRRDEVSPSLRALIEEGLKVSGEEYLAVKSRRDRALAHLIHLAADYDVVLAPAAPGAAPKGLEETGRPDQSRPWQLFGMPQVTLPGGFSQVGLPLGLQVIGSPRGDQSLLQVARWLQDELGWYGQIPPRFS